MRAARAVLVGPGARRALAAGAGARGIVEYAFGPGGYVRAGEEDWILLAPARSPVGPLSILVAGLGRGDLVAGAPVEVSRDAVVLQGTLRIDLSHAREAAPPLARLTLARGWRGALEAALDAVAPAPPPLAAGLGALAEGDAASAVASLAGLGAGLTPAGDDVLAGFAAWRWTQGAPVALPADRCSPLGRAYLRCAERGELPGPATAVLSAIAAGDVAAAARRARGVSAWGASSGAALLWGIAAATGRTSKTPARGHAEVPVP